MKTYTAKPETVKREWLIVDAEGQTLGRLASCYRSSPTRQAQARIHSSR